MKAYSGESEVGPKALAEWKQGLLKHFVGLFVICCGLLALALFVLLLEYLSRLESPKNPQLTSLDTIINYINNTAFSSYYRHRLSVLAPVWEEEVSKEERKEPIQSNAVASKEIHSLNQIKSDLENKVKKAPIENKTHSLKQEKSDSESKNQKATENIVKIATPQNKTELTCKNHENKTLEVVAEVHVPPNP